MNKIFLHAIIFLLFTSIGFMSCRHTLPPKTTENEGVLVVGLKVTDTTTLSGVPYDYFLSYTPETEVKIKIFPRAGKKYLIYEDFPVGRYSINTIIAVAQDKKNWTTSRSRSEMPVKIIFKINPGQLTLLSHRFEFEKTENADGGQRTRWGIRPIDSEHRSQIINELKELENANMWKLPAE